MEPVESWLFETDPFWVCEKACTLVYVTSCWLGQKVDDSCKTAVFYKGSCCYCRIGWAGRELADFFEPRQNISSFF